MSLTRFPGRRGRGVRLGVAGLLAGLAWVAAVALGGQPAAADVPPAVDAQNLNPVPVRTWGVSGQDPSQTQTETIDNLVWDFAQIGNRIFVGGAFLNVQESKYSNPISQPYLAAFDLDTGDWLSSWTPQFDRAVYSLDVLPNGSLLVGGEFETVNGQARAGVVALNPLTGTVDSAYPVSVDRPWSSNRAVVREAKVEGAQVYLAGNFSHINGENDTRTRAYKVGRTSTTGVLDVGWKPEVAGSGVWGISIDDTRGEVHLAGFFSSVNGEDQTGHFHTVNDSTGATAPGKIELPRNYPAAQLEMFDVVATPERLFVIGEQHIVQVLDPADHQMLGYHHTGFAADQFDAANALAGGAFQVGEKIGDVVFAGCHCTYSFRNGVNSHFSSFGQLRSPKRLAMAYDGATGELIEEFTVDIHSDRDGTWAFGSDTNGCLYIGGDFHVGGVDNGIPRWIGGFAKLCGTPPVKRLLVDPGTTWRYDDSGTDQGTAWREPGFDDANWTSGEAEFGFGDGDETTALATGRPTYYARTSFDFTGQKPLSLDLRLKADDGAVVYLNGVEVARDNLPDGPVAYDTLATTWRGGRDERTFRRFDISAMSLVDGPNVLAVEIHNVSSNNGDLSFDAYLDAGDVELADEPAAAPPLVPLGSVWAYTDSGVAIPADWPNSVAGGANAAAPFGFGEGDEATLVPTGQEAYYFAHQFEVAEEEAAAIAEAGAELDLTTVIDDGAVIYLNGVEVRRVNMPDGPISALSRPLTWVSGPDEQPVTVRIDGDALVDGTNTVTVELHNYWPGNPDLSFDLQLAQP